MNGYWSSKESNLSAVWMIATVCLATFYLKNYFLLSRTVI
jgi:hypothetical protein